MDAIATTVPTDSLPSVLPSGRGVWSTDEHERFLEALHRYPNGPWKRVADFIGTRSVRQVQTHAQKYHEKVARRLRGLRKERQCVKRSEHRIDAQMVANSLELHGGAGIMAHQPQPHQQPFCYLPAAPWVEWAPVDQSDHQYYHHHHHHNSMEEEDGSVGSEGEREESHDPFFDECLGHLIDVLSSSSDDE